MTTKSASTLGMKAILVGLASMQVNVDKVLRECDVDRSLIDDPDAKVSMNQVSKFWNAISENTNNPLCGITMAKLIPFGTYQTSDYLLGSSSNLREGLSRFIQYFGLIHQEVNIDMIVQEGKCTVSFSQKPLTTKSRENLEYEISLLHQRIIHLLNRDFSLKNVTLESEFQNKKQTYEEHFGCPVFLAGKSNSLVFDERYLTIPLVKSDSNLADLLEKSAQEQLNALPSEKRSKEIDFLDEFASALRRELSEGKASIQSMAKVFGMSTRTLQRKLKKYNLSYTDILTEVRKEMAKELLKNPSLTLTEISFLLGFSESSAFHRAFKQWMDVTPMDYRKNQI